MQRKECYEKVEHPVGGKRRACGFEIGFREDEYKNSYVFGLVLWQLSKPETLKGKIHSSQSPLSQHGDVYKRLCISVISAINVPGMVDKRDWEKYFNIYNFQCIMI